MAGAEEGHREPALSVRKRSKPANIEIEQSGSKQGSRHGTGGDSRLASSSACHFCGMPRVQLAAAASSSRFTSEKNLCLCASAKPKRGFQARPDGVVAGPAAATHRPEAAHELRPTNLHYRGNGFRCVSRMKGFFCQRLGRVGQGRPRTFRERRAPASEALATGCRTSPFQADRVGKAGFGRAAAKAPANVSGPARAHPLPKAWLPPSEEKKKETEDRGEQPSNRLGPTA